MATKKRSVDLVLEKLRKKYGDTSACISQKIAPVPRMPSGVLAFDLASGGGFPTSNLSVVWGGKDTGKSTFLYMLMATYQRLNPGKVVAFLDLEDNYDSEYGSNIGVDDDRLLRLQPDYAEMGIDMAHQVVNEADDVGLLAVDSLVGLVPSRELEISAEDAVVGTQGLLLSRFVRKTQNILSRIRREQGRRVTVVCVNQVRTKIGVMRGDPDMMPGGNALAHYASMVVKFYGGKEEVVAEVDPNRPVVKNITGVIQKKKGRTVARKFEFQVALEPFGGLRAGQQTDEWKTASAYLLDMGAYGKREDGKGWMIMGQQLDRQKDCREWYEQHRDECRSVILEHLIDNPSDV